MVAFQVTFNINFVKFPNKSSLSFYMTIMECIKILRIIMMTSLSRNHSALYKYCISNLEKEPYNNIN